MIDLAGWLLFLVIAAVIFFFIFWLWMLVDMFRSKIPGWAKGLWFVLFLVTWVAALIWVFVRPKKRRR